VGRPFRHLSGTIDWSGLPDDAHEVLETLIPIEREVSSLEDSRRFIMRVLPYRTVEGNIDGVVVTLVDITDLKRAEEEIRSAALFPSENPSPILRIQDDGTVLFSNRAAESLLSTWRSEFGKDLPDALLRCIKAALADGKIREYEANSDGRCTSFAVAPLPERRYANLYGHDVTDRKEAEEALRHAKEEWERTFDSVPDLIAILDNHHRMVRVNQAMAQRLGTSPEACIGQPCYQCVHGAESPPSYCPHVLTGADGQEHMAQFHEAHLGGDFLVTTTPLRDAQNRMIGAVHVARDISEQKKAEAEIRQQLQELERFNSVSVGRELRMIELKKEINELFRQAGKPPRYPLKFEED
jgi:PAS domain S-box-containing protein